MSSNTLILLLTVLLATGCALNNTRQPLQHFEPQRLALSSEPSPVPEPCVSANPSAKTTIAPPPITGKEMQLEVVRRERIQRRLDRIKKEAREEYASTRPESIRNSILKEELCLGMNDRDVLVCLGKPEKKSRLVYRNGTRESWIYGKLSVWLDNGIVSGWRFDQ